jgi:hemolysin activation/secretion protein
LKPAAAMTAGQLLCAMSCGVFGNPRTGWLLYQGDTGWVFQGEARYIVPGWKMLGGDVTVSAFWDQGWVRLNENQPAVNAGVANNRRISGYGLGGSLGKDGDFVLRASAAWRNEDELPQADTSPRTPRIWVQAIKWF